MEQYKEGQYDDDLTVGMDDYDEEDFDTGEVDLFDYVGDEDSPLSRLKSIILSIDWEINDDILRQFNEELHDLQGLWADNKVYLIYVQALEKISRYIYKEKSNAHPKAIKLLLTFYANLEKIVSDEEISESEKKRILREDVEKFEKLKSQIAAATPAAATKPAPREDLAPSPADDLYAAGDLEAAGDDFAESEEESIAAPAQTAPPQAAGFSSEEVSAAAAEEDPLINLKAIVYGMDWEITGRDLDNLGREVKRLEQHFSTSRVKQIFLQGIGSLGAYIKAKRSDAHADAFKLLHSFYGGLETVVRDNLSGQAEKSVLLPEVEKFNLFKTMIAGTLASDGAVGEAEDAPYEDEFEGEYEDEIQPAFAEMPEDVHGFRLEGEEGEASAGEDEGLAEGRQPGEVDEADNQLAMEMELRLEGMFDEPGEQAAKALDAEIALQGVDVETEADDESDEEPLPEEDGELIPALGGERLPDEVSPAAFAEEVEQFFEGDEDEEVATGSVPGVDVEHEADDDSEEEPLRLGEDGEYAPALADDDWVAAEDEEEVDEREEVDASLDAFFGEVGETEDEVVEEEVPEKTAEPAPSGDIDQRLSDFFGEAEAEFAEEPGAEALKGVDVETVADDDSEELPLPFADDGEIAPALSADFEEEEDDFTGQAATEEIVEPLDRGEEPFEDGELSIAAEESDIPGEAAADQPFLEEALAEETDPVSEAEAAGLREVAGEEPGGEEEEVPASAPVDSGEELEWTVEASEDFPPAGESDLEERFEALFSEEEDEAELEDESWLAEDEEEPAEFAAESFSEAGFEELDDEDIGEFPEEAIRLVTEESPERREKDEGAEKPLPAEEDEILSLLGEDEVPDETFGDYPEEDIPEMTAEEIGASIIADDDEAITTAGHVPMGYPSADELLSESGEIAGGTGDYADGFAEDEEEVVFEAVDEDDLAEAAAAHGPGAAGEETPAGGDEDEEALFFGTTLLPDEAAERTPEAAVEPAPEEMMAEVAGEVDEGRAYIAPATESAGADTLAELRNCIVSLGLEIDDTILSSLNQEIDKLRDSWSERPLERTFLQLLATISNHIERYRYEADAEANRILLSVFEKLELSARGEADGAAIQEALLTETSKVLQWQERLVERAAFKRDEEARGSGEAQARLDDMSRKVDEIGNDMLMQRMSSVMRAELEELKEAFHAELIELREEMNRRG